MASVEQWSAGIDAEGLDAFVADHAFAVVLLLDVQRAPVCGVEDLAAACSSAQPPAALAWVDVARAPALPALFGMSQVPCLLVFRERVVLFAAQVWPSPEGLTRLLDQVGALDMVGIRREIDAMRLGRDALMLRRACPVLRRGNGT